VKKNTLIKHSNFTDHCWLRSYS